MANQWNTDQPIYIQLYHQVITRILDGFIKEGEALPSVRKVAAEYQLNPITISKAYLSMTFGNWQSRDLMMYKLV